MNTPRYPVGTWVRFNISDQVRAGKVVGYRNHWNGRGLLIDAPPRYAINDNTGLAYVVAEAYQEWISEVDVIPSGADP